MSRLLSVMVQTPASLLDPSIAIAGSRSGAIGILSLDLPRDEKRTTAAITKLVRFAKGSIGVKLRSGDSQVEKISSQLPSGASIILVPDQIESVKKDVTALRQSGLTVFLEATRPE